MQIHLKLDDILGEALKRFRTDNPVIASDDDAAARLIKKALQGLGYVAPDPGIGTRPDKLNSSNDG